MSFLEGMDLTTYWTRETQACELMSAISSNAAIVPEFPTGVTSDPQNIYVRQLSAAETVTEDVIPSYVPLVTWVRRAAAEEQVAVDDDAVATIAALLAAKIVTAAAMQEREEGVTE